MIMMQLLFKHRENKAWPKRNGEGRGDREKEKPRSAWRSDQDSNRGRPVDRRQDPPRGNTSGRYGTFFCFISLTIFKL